MERKYNLKHIGEVFTTTEGYKVKIIDGGLKNDYCLIEFRYNKLRLEAKYYHIKNRVLKNPYHPSVFGKGFLGVGSHKASTRGELSSSYVKWSDMLRRCYSDKIQEKHPTYKGVTVAKEWHNFQVFAEWYEAQYNPNDDFELDKDLLSGDNKIYSPETCCLIPRYLNLFLTNKHSNNTTGRFGVYKNGNRYQTAIRDGKGGRRHLGIFKTKEEASLAYELGRKIRVEEIIHQLSTEYPLIKEEIINSIIQ